VIVLTGLIFHPGSASSFSAAAALQKLAKSQRKNSFAGNRVHLDIVLNSLSPPERKRGFELKKMGHFLSPVLMSISGRRWRK